MLFDAKTGMGIGSEAEIDIFLFWFEIKIIVQSIFISKQSMIFYYLICPYIPYIPYMAQIVEIRQYTTSLKDQ